MVISITMALDLEMIYIPRELVLILVIIVFSIKPGGSIMNFAINLAWVVKFQLQLSRANSKSTFLKPRTHMLNFLASILPRES